VSLNLAETSVVKNEPPVMHRLIFSFLCCALDYAGHLVSFWADVNLPYHIALYVGLWMVGHLQKVIFSVMAVLRSSAISKQSLSAVTKISLKFIAFFWLKLKVTTHSKKLKSQYSSK